jgi:hypothetical protein
MATEISNGKQTVKLYHSVNRGKAMCQLAYYAGGKRVQKNFADKSEAKRVAKEILENCQTTRKPSKRWQLPSSKASWRPGESWH